MSEEKDQTVFCIRKHTFINEILQKTSIVGIFTDRNIAVKVYRDYESIFPDIENDGVEIQLEISEIPLDTIILDDFEEEKDESPFEILMKEGIVDYTVNEEGDFVFELTDFGKKVVDKIKEKTGEDL